MPPASIVLLSLLAAIIPTLLFCALIYWADRYEKEPWWLLAAAFLWGAIPSIGLAFVFNSALSLPIYTLVADATTADALAASIIAPPVEETVKAAALLGILFFWRYEIDSPLDGIIYGAMVGMGFAMVENFYYFISTFAEQGAEAWRVNILLRALVFGLNHAMFTGMVGLGIGIGRFATRPLMAIGAPIAGWITAVLLHFLHNFSVSLGNNLCFLALLFDWGGVLLTAGIIMWAVVQERRWIESYLAEEVDLGVLSRAQYARVHSRRLRTQDRLARLFDAGPQSYRRARDFYHRCSELAYKKHHFALFGDAHSAQMIAALREEIIRLGRLQQD